MPQTKVRVVGSGFTTFSYNNKPIAFAEGVEDSGQRAFSDLDDLVHAVTPHALGARHLDRAFADHPANWSTNERGNACKI